MLKFCNKKYEIYTQFKYEKGLNRRFKDHATDFVKINEK